MAFPAQSARHWPQCALSVDRSAQVLAQVAKPEVHCTPHIPPLQSGAPAGQAFPHAPQLRRLVRVSTQLPMPPNPPAHCVYPGEHWQVPLMHAEPPGHAVPHAPQFLLFVCRFTQALPHNVRPVAQVRGWQTPAVQTEFPGQTRPHRPQLRGSVCVLVHEVPQTT
jgi:hypothetical protein